MSPELSMIKTQQRYRGTRALHVAANLDKMPAFAMAHGGIGHTLNQVDAFDHRQQKVRRQNVFCLIRLVPRYLMKKMVQTLPLVGADFFADLACILPGRGYTRCNR